MLIFITIFCCSRSPVSVDFFLVLCQLGQETRIKNVAQISRVLIYYCLIDYGAQFFVRLNKIPNPVFCWPPKVWRSVYFIGQFQKARQTRGLSENQRKRTTIFKVGYNRRTEGYALQQIGGICLVGPQLALFLAHKTGLEKGRWMASNFGRKNIPFTSCACWRPRFSQRPFFAPEEARAKKILGALRHPNISKHAAAAAASDYYRGITLASKALRLKRFFSIE